ncbi:hypothetical protein R1sor_005727 [Riccia sorocarpa]|uniref:Uncharacterized protein n=1 Tax=Riccia sorocarpa TaxID=122646 RepID=A0ABD3HMQ9_9MARC
MDRRERTRSMVIHHRYTTQAPEKLRGQEQERETTFDVHKRKGVASSLRKLLRSLLLLDEHSNIYLEGTHIVTDSQEPSAIPFALYVREFTRYSYFPQFPFPVPTTGFDMNQDAAYYEPVRRHPSQFVLRHNRRVFLSVLKLLFQTSSSLELVQAVIKLRVVSRTAIEARKPIAVCIQMIIRTAQRTIY